METVTSIASAASKVIWGETKTNETAGQEPLSGELGDTSKGEAYDKGNEVPATTSAPSAVIEPSGEEPLSGVKGDTATGEPFDKGNEIGLAPKTEPSGEEPLSGEKGNTAIGEPFDKGNIGSTQLAVPAKPVSDESSEGPSPVATSEPGLVLLEKAKQSGGNVGASEKDEGLVKQSHGAGANERDVKSNGVNADGDLSDAAKPAPSKEADRLVEEKGIHHDSQVPGTSADDMSSSPSRKSSDSPKRSLKDKIKDSHLKEKIKEKLHRN